MSEDNKFKVKTRSQTTAVPMENSICEPLESGLRNHIG